MYCTKCGHANMDGVSFCENCGAELTKLESVELPLESVDEGVPVEMDAIIELGKQSVESPKMEEHQNTEVTEDSLAKEVEAKLAEEVGQATEAVEVVPAAEEAPEETPEEVPEEVPVETMAPTPMESPAEPVEKPTQGSAAQEDITALAVRIEESNRRLMVENKMEIRMLAIVALAIGTLLMLFGNMIKTGFYSTTGIVHTFIATIIEEEFVDAVFGSKDYVWMVIHGIAAGVLICTLLFLVAIIWQKISLQNSIARARLFRTGFWLGFLVDAAIIAFVVYLGYSRIETETELEAITYGVQFVDNSKYIALALCLMGSLACDKYIRIGKTRKGVTKMSK